MKKKKLFHISILTFLILFSFIKIGFTEEANTSAEALLEHLKLEVSKVTEDLTWEDLSIEFREVKKVATEGFIPMKLKDTPSSRLKDKIYYVSSVAEIDLKDVSDLDIYYAPLTDNCGITIILNKLGKDKLMNYTSKHINEMLGIVIDGKLCIAARITAPMSMGELRTGGVFTPNEAVDIARRFFKPFGPILPLMQDRK